MIFILIICLLLAPVTGFADHNAPQSDRLKTIQSIEKLDDFPLYVMRFYGDYDIPDYKSKTAHSEADHRENPDTGFPSGHSPCWACTCFAAKTEQGNQLLGRNFDWASHPALLLFTDPPDRYASVSMVDISYLGFAKSDAPDKNPGRLLRSPLLPFDGMNEMGLAVGMMALSSAQAPDDPDKKTVSSLMIIRLILDYAKNVEEAITLFENFNIDFQGGPPLHYLITDRSGKSVVIEFLDQKLSILRSAHPWQVATNFILTGLSQDSALSSCWRYKKVWETLEAHPALRSSSDAHSLLEDVSQGNTIWSVVYDTASLDFQVVMGKKYDRIHEFNLKRALSDPQTTKKKP